MGIPFLILPLTAQIFCIKSIIEKITGTRTPVLGFAGSHKTMHMYYLLSFNVEVRPLYQKMLERLRRNRSSTL